MVYKDPSGKNYGPEKQGSAITALKSVGPNEHDTKEFGQDANFYLLDIMCNLTKTRP